MGSVYDWHLKMQCKTAQDNTALYRVGYVLRVLLLEKGTKYVKIHLEKLEGVEKCICI